MKHGAEFMGLILDAETLTTPDGVISLRDLIRADFVRDVVRTGNGPSTNETSVGAVAGGAVVGGALLGPVGAIGGGLLGSTVKEEVPGAPTFTTNSVQLVFETENDAFQMDIPHDKELHAHQFAKKVQHAAKLHEH